MGPTCTPYCDLNAPDICPQLEPGAECIPLFEMGMAPDGKENVGACGVP